MNVDIRERDFLWDVTNEWSALQWKQGSIKESDSLPSCAGLYRISWASASAWNGVRTKRLVKAAKSLGDQWLDFSDRKPPVVLTIGRTLNIKKRIGQHFGTNPHNNRVIRRMAEILPGRQRDELLRLAHEALEVEWVAVSNWVSRCRLEKYGCALDAPIFDLEAEH
jgi:hypothetical protein